MKRIKAWWNRKREKEPEYINVYSKICKECGQFINIVAPSAIVENPLLKISSITSTYEKEK